VTRGPCTFKQSDVTRAVKGVIAAGVPVGQVEIAPDGKIVITSTQDVETGTEADADEGPIL
jgi:hypothetical protein